MADLITYRKVYADQSSRICCAHVRTHEVESFIANLVLATPENPRKTGTEQPFYVCEVRAQ